MLSIAFSTHDAVIDRRGTRAPRGARAPWRAGGGESGGGVKECIGSPCGGVWGERPEMGASPTPCPRPPPRQGRKSPLFHAQDTGISREVDGQMFHFPLDTFCYLLL